MPRTEAVHFCPQGPWQGLARVGKSAIIQGIGEVQRRFWMQSPPELQSNIVAGAQACAEYIWGPGSKAQKFYDLIRRTNFPWARLGSTLIIRKTVVDAYLAAQEEQNLHRFAANGNEPPAANDDEEQGSRDAS